MHRADFLRQLNAFVPLEDREETRERFRAFVSAEPRCFERDLQQGHVTGSAWLVSPDGRSVLLTHHRKLDKWLQLGGHADGDGDVLRVALREAEEESGLTGIEPVMTGIFDMDIHEIPERKGEPAHLHFDARFLLRAPTLEFAISDESHDLAWVPFEDVPRFSTEESILRMHRLWHRQITR